MSKRYVIQVYVVNEDNATLNAWQNVQHPAGGDWLTRSRTAALADAAKLVRLGETRELRIGLSQPVYSVTLDSDMDAINAVVDSINAGYAAAVGLDADADKGDDELSADEVDALGLDSTGRDGNERFPYTWNKLTIDERDALVAYRNQK